MIEAFRIGGATANFIKVEILSRPWASKRDYWDGNHVECRIEIALAPISAVYSDHFWLFDFKKFQEEIEAMHRTLKGRAEFRPLSQALFVDLTMSSLGHVDVSGEACTCASPLQKIVFQMMGDIDQTHLVAIDKQLTIALEAYPIFEG